MKRWPTKPLRELITIEKGKKAPAVFPVPTKTSPRYLQIEDLRPDAGLKYCEPFKCPRATKSDVILAWDGANAGTVSCNLEGHIGSTLAILRPVGIDTLSAVFLSRFLQGNFEYLQTTATGATIPHVSKDALNSLQIPVPPLAEQERIVELLDEADELRKLRARADRRAAALIPAIFHEMFGDPDSNPRKLPVVPLGNLLSFRTGKLDSNAAVEDGEYPFFTCSREDFRIDTYSFDCEALLLAGNNAIGEYSVKYYKGKFNAYQRTYVLSLLNPDDSYSFMQQALQLRLQELKRSSLGTNTKYLTLGILKGVNIPLPNPSLQKEFAARVTEIRGMESAQSASRKRLDDLFQSMLHRAFNGEL